MARSKKQFLQNVHTTKMYSPEVIAGAELKDGEIAVFQNTKQPSLGIKVGDNTYAQFKDSEAVTAEITSAKDELSETIKENTKNIGELTAKFGSYATSAQTVAADTKTLTDAKSYTDLLKAKTGETYNNETLAGLKSEIDSLKGDSTTTVGALATRVTQAENDIDALEEKVGDNTNGLVKNVADLKTTVGDSTTGLVKDVADLKTKDSDLIEKIDAVSGASSAYTDSQINAIKGTSYKEGTTLASLESNLEEEKKRINAILQDAPEDLHSFKDVDTKITNAITAAYKYQGSVNNYNDLPESGKTTGYVYNVVQAVGTPGTADYTPAGTNYAWNGTTWDALGGTVDLSTYATTAITNGLESRLDTAEANIGTLTAATGTLNTSITTIQGWKINGTAITSDTVLNGNNLKVDATADAKTLKEAIAEAASSGSDANNAFTAWTAGTYTQNKKDTDGKLNEIDAYTVNGLKISEKPVLTGENVKVSTSTTAQSLNEAIVDAKAAGTAASNAVDTLRGGYEGTIKTINDSVTANTQSITTINGTLATASSRANSAIQKITIKENATAGVKISDPTGDDGAKTQELDFSAIVIDCGEF